MSNWIEVKTIEDLPKEFGLYHFIPCNRKEERFIGLIDFKLGEVIFFDEENYSLKETKNVLKATMNAWLVKQITHYKPIV